MTIYSWQAIDDDSDLDAAFAALTALDDESVVRALLESPWEVQQQGQVSA